MSSAFDLSILPDVDGYGGKKRKIMEALAETLGKKGATASKILEAMGPPDEIVPKVGATNVGPLEAAGPGAIIGGMPGPVISGDGPNASVAGTGKPYFLVYHWRGRHDYLVSNIVNRFNRDILPDNGRYS